MNIVKLDNITGNFNLKEENKTLKFEKETAQDTTEFWKEQFIKINGKYQNILKLAKRKGLMSVKHTTNGPVNLM